MQVGLHGNRCVGCGFDVAGLSLRVLLSPLLEVGLHRGHDQPRPRLHLRRLASLLQGLLKTRTH